MKRVDSAFKDRVYELVGSIPEGRIMTYGQVAALCGAAWAAWEVGQIAHRGPAELPWQRVVRKDGSLARGYPGGLDGHKAALVSDAVSVDEDYKVNVENLLWNPHQTNLL